MNIQEHLIVMLIIFISVTFTVYFIWTKIQTSKSDRDFKNLDKQSTLSKEIQRLESSLPSITHAHIRVRVEERLEEAKRELATLLTKK